MPKYCTAPNCKNDSNSTGSERKSFYKYPINNPERLRLWLKNMGRETWTPSSHQYLCHEHFQPSCFTLRWGIRYLANNAVPTIFDLSENNKKRKGADRFQRRAKCQRSTFMTSQMTVTVASSESKNQFCTLDTGEETGGERPLLHTNKDVASSKDGQKVVFERSSEVEQKVEGHKQTVQIAVQESFSQEADDSLAIRNTEVKVKDNVQVVAYFETSPSTPSPNSTGFGNNSPKMLLSSTPITSTTPIVPKHTRLSPESLILTLEKLVPVNEEGQKKAEDDDALVTRSRQLEQHRYRENRLSKEQLEAIVAELQKKVKVLQQRHRRHLDKLLGLESTVAQLRQTNIMLEERLRLLKEAYLQTSAAEADSVETVAIIYEDDSTSYVWNQD